MSKMKIEIRKPQYLATKEPVAEVKKAAKKEKGKEQTPFFLRLLLVASFMLSGLAIWYAYQKFSAHS